jgi:hypothetical protein
VSHRSRTASLLTILYIVYTCCKHIRQYEGPYSISGQSVWGLWRTTWHCDRFFSEYLDFPPNYLPTNAPHYCPSDALQSLKKFFTLHTPYLQHGKEVGHFDQLPRSGKALFFFRHISQEVEFLSGFLNGPV